MKGIGQSQIQIFVSKTDCSVGSKRDTEGKYNQVLPMTKSITLRCWEDHQNLDFKSTFRRGMEMD